MLCRLLGVKGFGLRVLGECVFHEFRTCDLGHTIQDLGLSVAEILQALSPKPSTQNPKPKTVN